jgi:hypothetical protein
MIGIIGRAMVAIISTIDIISLLASLTLIIIIGVVYIWLAYGAASRDPLLPEPKGRLPFLGHTVEGVKRFHQGYLTLPYLPYPYHMLPHRAHTTFIIG